MGEASHPIEQLGKAALRYVRAGAVIGLGTGRAATAFIHALAASGLDVSGVPTSQDSADLATRLGIKLTTLDEAERLSVDVDGADEVDPKMNLIKGWGGALVREKIVAAASKRRVILVGAEKMVKRLGQRGRLPVEVIPFAAAFCIREVRKLGLKPVIRKNDHGQDFVTDNGNLILDCGTAPILSPAKLDHELRLIPGVVGTGLFVGIADVVLVAGDDGKIRTLTRTAQSRK